MTEHTIKCNKFNKFFSIVYNLCCCERRKYYQYLVGYWGFEPETLRL